MCLFLAVLIMTFYDVSAMIYLAMAIMLSSSRIIGCITGIISFLLHCIGERVEYDHSNCYTSNQMLCSSYINCKVFGCVIPLYGAT